jgi:hypothetical protein
MYYFKKMFRSKVVAPPPPKKKKKVSLGSLSEHGSAIIPNRRFFASGATSRVARWFFRTKNPNLGKFWMAIEWKLQVYFMVIWNILR